MGKKVGIVSCYFKNNYGSMLQAYATQKFLDNNNIPNETINVSNLIDFKKGKKKYYMSQLTNLGFIKTKLGMVKLKGYQKINKNLGRNFNIRNGKFKEFKRAFNLTRAFQTYENIKLYAYNNYSDVIVGSDQLWLPVNIVADYYTLNWVPKEINKISFATSFGVSSIPKKYEQKYSNFLSRLNYISVRENNAIGLVQKLSNKSAKLVCDPTLLLSKEQWMEIQDDKRLLDEKYIFCYFLGNNIEHRKFVQRLKEKTGYKIVSINHCDEYVKYSDTFADIVPYDVGPSEFINYIRNAEYVCTDSFHGTVFSLINNTKFFTFERFNKNNKMSTNSRIHSLLEIVNLKDRLVFGNEDVDVLLKNEINFERVNKELNVFIEDSKKWLLHSIAWKNNDRKQIEIQSKYDCCGCTACANICPKNAIKMVEDEEGFIYPSVDKEQCVDCGLCKKICPIVNSRKETKCHQDAYVINNKDVQVRKESTSGGFFTAIAEHVIDKGGYVYGAAFDDEYVVKHMCASSKDELKKFRNSKYVQSNPTNTFGEVQSKLNEGKLVCYSGTPCQIEGLKGFLQADYDNLILVDVVCRAVPSPKVFAKYLSYIKKEKLNNEDIVDVKFRSKEKYGYKYTLMVVKSKNNVYQEGIDTDPYLRAFFSGLSIRPSCENCKFKKLYRVSDFTIWDCFNVEDFNKSMDDNNGTTRVLVHSEKGKRIFDEIKSKLIYGKFDSNVVINGSKELLNCTKINENRAKFFEDFNNMDYADVVKKYFPNSLKIKFEKMIRVKLVNFKGYKKLKRLAKKLLGR